MRHRVPACLKNTYSYQHCKQGEGRTFEELWIFLVIFPCLISSGRLCFFASFKQNLWCNHEFVSGFFTLFLQDTTSSLSSFKHSFLLTFNAVKTSTGRRVALCQIVFDAQRPRTINEHKADDKLAKPNHCALLFSRKT